MLLPFMSHGLYMALGGSLQRQDRMKEDKGFCVLPTELGFLNANINNFGRRLTSTG